MRRLHLLPLALAVVCCLLVFVSTRPILGQETTTGDLNDGGQRQQSSGGNGDNGGGGSGGGGGGIFNLIFTPLRATMEHARRLLTHRLGGARDLVANGFNEIQVQTFQMFMSLYNKTYSPEEIPRRMALFFERRKVIEQSVRDFASGKLPFMMRENTFVDWDETELKALAGVSPPKSFAEMTPEEREVVTELRHQSAQDELIYSDDDDDDDDDESERGAPASGVSHAFDRNNTSWQKNNVDELDDDDTSGGARGLTVRATERIPAAKDWRASGCVSTPINQLKCGACYAIATVSVVESMRCINQVSSPILAPQQVVDCSTPRAGYQNFGCDGGWPTRVLKYLQDVRVAARESCYPFVRRQNSCKLNSVKAISGCTVSSSPSDTSLRYKVLNNERDILYHVAKTGPVVTVMRATDKFLYYGSGIFDDPKCTRKRDDVDHAIVIAGYGRENGQDYWLIKNSWGTTDWGEGGYGKYKRGTNACSIGHWGWVVTN